MWDFEPEIKIFVATGIAGFFLLLFFGNADSYLCPVLFKKRNDNIVQAVIMKGEISSVLSGSGFQEQAVVSDRGGIKSGPGWHGGSL